MPQPKAIACPKGHAYDEENTYVYDGKQACRKCRAAHVRRYKKANPKRVAAAYAAWLRTNPDYHRKWQTANRDRINARRRERYAASRNKHQQVLTSRNLLEVC